MRKQICPNCGREIVAPNFKKHYKACINPNSKTHQKQEQQHVQHDGLDCIYCGKTCKNKKSLAQHEVRCLQNPNRKDVMKLTSYIIENRKGKNKNNCADVQKQVNTVLQKYANGYTSPTKGRKVGFQYLYEEHNQLEIQKWLDYIKTHQEDIPTQFPQSRSYVEGYVWLSGERMFLQEYIISKFLNVDCSQYTIHHINKYRDDNTISNLMIFASGSDHKRYHSSKYAYLTYNSETHVFTCELKKGV